MLEIIFLGLEIVWNSEILNGDFMTIISNHLFLNQNFISRSEISSHTSSLSLVEEIFLLEQPTLLIFGDVNDIFIADQPLKRHLEDIFQVDD
jgi:hypothetical protein